MVRNAPLRSWCGYESCVDHPHGGGEGKSAGGRHPVKDWANKVKTRRKNKYSDFCIIRKRK